MTSGILIFNLVLLSKGITYDPRLEGAECKCTAPKGALCMFVETDLFPDDKKHLVLMVVKEKDHSPYGTPASIKVVCTRGKKEVPNVEAPATTIFDEAPGVP